MRLLLVRHGEAGPYQPDDAARQLTDRGRTDIAALGRLLADEKLALDLGIVSPYQRTRQTFAGLAEHNVWQLEPVIEQAMTPDTVMEHVLERLRQCQHHQTVLVVSHQPLLSMLAAVLITGSARYAGQYPMPPGSLADLDVPQAEPGCATLRRLLSPPYHG